MRAYRKILFTTLALGNISGMKNTHRLRKTICGSHNISTKLKNYELTASITPYFVL